MCGISPRWTFQPKDLTNVCQTFRLVPPGGLQHPWKGLRFRLQCCHQGRKKTKVTNLPTKKQRMYCSNDEFFYIDLLINHFREWVHFIYSHITSDLRGSQGDGCFKSSWNHPAIHYPKHQGPHGFKTTGLWGFAESWCCWSSQGWAKCWTNVGI